MRITYGKNITKLAVQNKKIVVLTGDLGYGVFENLVQKAGTRFINCGVAEHNMVTVAAGLAYAGMLPWIYSIASFVTLKVFEEIRDDISLPGNNVKVVGLGGGFDYGLAGPTQHTLQDVSIILSLQNFKVYVPGFTEDLWEIMKKMQKEKNPSYLRLTKAEKTDFKIPAYSPVRRMIKGTKITVIVLGSMINRVLPAYLELGTNKSVDMWLISEMPFEFPKELINSIKKTRNLVVIEEHVKMGALGSYVNDYLREKKIELKNYNHMHVKGYFSHRYGSRDCYLKENGLDKESIKKTVISILQSKIGDSL